MIGFTIGRRKSTMTIPAPPAPRFAPGPGRGGVAALAALTILAASSLLARPAAAADAGTRWIGSWMASPQRPWQDSFVLPTNLPDLPQGRIENHTIRQVARISLGGRRIRIRLSNEFGSQPLRVGAVRVALAGEGSSIMPGSDRTATFGGSRSAIIAPGAPLLSDPIDLAVADLSRIAVSIFLPEPTPMATFHWDARQTGWIVAGNQVAAPAWADATPMPVRLFLSGIQVESPTATGGVVVLGDSITDGNGATMDADTRWPDFLAGRLARWHLATLNAGISGARLLGDLMGANALARFDRDVLGQPGVHTLIVLLGSNDIAWPGSSFDPHGSPPDTGSLIAGYRQLAARARASGLRIIGATLPPFEGALQDTPIRNYHDPQKNRMRQRINDWMRDSGTFDAVVDIDALLRDPQHPTRLAAAYDSGDHLHPGDAGNAALAAGVAAILLQAQAARPDPRESPQ